MIATKLIDKASPKLAEALTSGGLLTDVVIEITRSPAGLSESTYFECRLREAYVIFQLLEAPSTDSLPSESVSLNYSRLDWIYRVLDLKGTVLEQVGAYWDFVDNSGGAASGVPGNQPPTSDTIGNQSVDPGTTSSIDFLVSDCESDPADLIVTATTSRPDLINDLLVTGTERERQISFRSRGVLSGAAVVSVIVSDGISSRTMSFSVLIDVEMTHFEGFLSAYFSDEARVDPALASPILDPDKDGLLTLVEYLLGTNPREFNSPTEAIAVELSEEAGVRRIDFQFRRRTDDPLIQGAIWGSSNMKDWTKLEASNPLYEETSTQSENPLFDDVSDSVTVPYFIRLQVLDAF